MDTCRALSITKSWWGHLISQQNHVLVRSALVDTGRALSITSLVSTFIRTGIDICSISYRNLIRFIFVYISHYLLLKLYISSRDHRTIEKLTYRYWACLITSPRGHHFHPSPTYDVSVFICIPAYEGIVVTTISTNVGIFPACTDTTGMQQPTTFSTYWLYR